MGNEGIPIISPLLSKRYLNGEYLSLVLPPNHLSNSHSIHWSVPTKCTLSVLVHAFEVIESDKCHCLVLHFVLGKEFIGIRVLYCFGFVHLWEVKSILTDIFAFGWRCERAIEVAVVEGDACFLNVVQGSSQVKESSIDADIVGVRRAFQDALGRQGNLVLCYERSCVADDLSQLLRPRVPHADSVGLHRIVCVLRQVGLRTDVVGGWTGETEHQTGGNKDNLSQIYHVMYISYYVVHKLCIVYII